VPVRREFDAVVIGAGFSGLYMLHRLREMGLAVRVYEAADGVGGTWYWNRYPGARCDSESHYYCFSFSKELLQEWTWTERYPAQPEVLKYLNFVADKLDLRRDIQFRTRVTQAIFDEAAQRWQIATDRGDQATAQYLITGVGCLSAPNLPSFKGLDRFQGEWYHTGRWPHETVDFTGKRVGLIGTGATGIQVVPEVAPAAEHLYVFQRSPNFAIPGRNRPLSLAEMEQIRACYDEIWAKARYSFGGYPMDFAPHGAMELSPEERQRAFEAAWAKGGFYFLFNAANDLLVNKASNDAAAEFIRNHIRKAVRDPKVAELLCPYDHPFATKRPPLEHGYFEAFNRENVTLVDVRNAPIEEITPTGIKTRDAEYELDVIIFATGFDAITGSLLKIDIRGRGGVTLQQKWAEGPRTYLGITTAGFPNLFMITGPQSPSVLTNMPMAIEQHVEWIAACIQELRSRGAVSIEATPEAEQRWVYHANEVASRTLYPQADSWYVGANIPGKPRMVMPCTGGLGPYRKICDEVAAKGYEGFAVVQGAAD